MKKLFFLLSFILFSVCYFGQSRYVSQTTKQVVFSRDGGRCQCCGSYDNLEFDHIKPYSCGGGSEISNIQLLCFTCNRSKSNGCHCKVHNKKVGTDCCQKKTRRSDYKNSSTYQYKSSSEARQCFGTTKKGTRCKNRTKNPSGRCHHHN